MDKNLMFSIYDKLITDKTNSIIRATSRGRIDTAFSLLNEVSGINQSFVGLGAISNKDAYFIYSAIFSIVVS